MDHKFKFTHKRLEELTCPEGKSRACFQDSARPELLIQVTSKGAKSYYYRGWNRVTEYTDRIHIAKFDQIDLESARKRAREIAAQLAQGIDPNAEKRALKQEVSFSEAFGFFLTDPIKRRKKGPRREKTTKEYQAQYERYLARRIGARKLSTLETRAVDELHMEIGENNGIYAANRTVALISGVFNDAIRRGWKGHNPAQGIERFPERRRQRFLKEDEIGPFIRACEIEREAGSRIVAEATLLALFTGLRRENVCAAAWDELDLERGTWSVPDNEMKNGEAHVAYLSRYVREILLERYQERTCDTWVFPGRGKTGHLVEPKNGISKIARGANIDPKGVHLHCMKHTFITFTDDAGVPAAVKKRLACHKVGKDVTERYTHVLEPRVKEAYEQVAQHMLQFVDTKSSSATGPSAVSG